MPAMAPRENGTMCGLVLVARQLELAQALRFLLNLNNKISFDFSVNVNTKTIFTL